MNSPEERADCCERMAGNGYGLSGECFDENLPGFFFGALEGEGFCQREIVPHVWSIEKRVRV